MNPSFEKLLEAVLRRIEDALENVDSDLVDVERGPDTLMLTFASGVRLVISPQRPVEQIWVATKNRGFHFGLDAKTGQWIEDKGRCGELFELLRSQIHEHAHIDVAL